MHGSHALCLVAGLISDEVEDVIILPPCSEEMNVKLMSLLLQKPEDATKEVAQVSDYRYY